MTSEMQRHFLEEFDDVLLCVGLDDRNQHCIELRTVETALNYFVSFLVRPSHFDAYIVKLFALV